MWQFQFGGGGVYITLEIIDFGYPFINANLRSRVSNNSLDFAIFAGGKAEGSVDQSSCC